MRACSLWLGVEQRRCGATGNVRRFLVGYRCPEHTPARVGAGRDWFRTTVGGGARQ